MKRKTGLILITILIAILTGGIFLIRHNVKRKAEKIEQCTMQRIESNVYEDDFELKTMIRENERERQEADELCGDCWNNCHSLCDDVWESVEYIEKTTQDMRKVKKTLEARLYCHRINGYSDYELRQLGFSTREIYGL